MISETLMGPGTFDISLRDDTPPSLLSRLTLDKTAATFGYATLVVSNGRIAPEAIAATTTTALHPLMDQARWSGVLTATSGHRTRLSGHGLGWFLGAPDKTGELYAGASLTGSWHVMRPFRRTGAGWFDWIVKGGVRPSDEGIATVDVTLRGSHLTGALFVGNDPAELVPFPREWTATRAQMLNWVCVSQGGWIYTITPQGQVRFGEPEAVFPQVRTVVGDVDPDPGWTTVRTVGHPDEDQDLAGWSNKSIGVQDAATPTEVWCTTGTVSPYLGPDGVALHISERVDPGRQESKTDWGNRMFAEGLGVDGRYLFRRSVKLTGTVFDHGVKLNPGETVWLHEPSLGLFDASNPVTVAGSVIYPVPIRLEGLTWPVTAEMGVYLIGWDQTSTPKQVVVDLSDYFEPEDGNTTLEVGELVTPL